MPGTFVGYNIQDQDILHNNGDELLSTAEFRAGIYLCSNVRYIPSY